MNNKDLLLLNLSNNVVVIGTYVQDYPNNRKSFNGCLVIRGTEMAFFPGFVVEEEPIEVKVFCRDNRDEFIQIINNPKINKDNNALSQFITRYDGIQYFGEVKDKIRIS